MISEVIYWGYIEIPYPYLESYRAAILSLKEGELDGINFFKLVEPPKESYKAAIASFSDIVKFEVYNEIENKIVEGFEFYLKRIGFLTATLLIALEADRTLFFQYVFDGEVVSKFKNKVLQHNNEFTVFDKKQ